LEFLGRDICCKKHTHDASEELLFYALQCLFYERIENIWAGKNDDLMVHAMDEIGTCRRAGVDESLDCPPRVKPKEARRGWISKERQGGVLDDDVVEI
jgi:hypothetical protein